MKRYDIITDRIEPEVIKRDNGDWVPASVAQALYDALESLAPEVSIDLLRAAGADKALSLADGEE